MNIKIIPKKLNGTLRCIDSKSHAHRLIIASAMADTLPFGKVNNANFDDNALDDKNTSHQMPCKNQIIKTTTACERNQNSCHVNINDTSQDIEVTKRGISAILNGEKDIYCGESGSTLRFLLPMVAVVSSNLGNKTEITFWGKGRLPERPLHPLDEEMIKHRCKIYKSTDSSEEICTISGDISSGEYILPGDVSSQYITGLLMSLPLLEGDSNIKLTSPMESKGYVDLTLKVLEDFGIEINIKGDDFFIPGGQKYSAPSSEIYPESDWSQGAFWLVAKALGSDINLTGLNDNSVQGDRAIKKIIEEFESVKNSIELCETEKPFEYPQAITIDARNIPDLIPVVSVLAALSPCKTVITNAERLRIKESDRITSTCNMIKSLGGNVIEEENGMTIIGEKSLTGGTVDGARDHRIVMAGTIASSACENPVTILGAEAVSKSYPKFFEDYEHLGGIITEIS